MDNSREWEAELLRYGLDWEHPEYLEDEEYIMGYRGAGELRMAEPDKEGSAPRYLILREAIRREVRGLTKSPNNYAKLAVRVYERMQEDILSKNAINLTSEYHPRVNDGDGTGDGDGIERKEYTIEELIAAKGPFSPEEERILRRIWALKKEWIRTTYREGRRLMSLGAGDPGTVRKKWLSDGTAAKMIIKHMLPIDFFERELLSEYTSRKTFYTEKTEPVKVDTAKDVVVEKRGWFRRLLNFIWK